MVGTFGGGKETAAIRGRWAAAVRSEPFGRGRRDAVDEALLVDLPVHETVISALQREGHASPEWLDGLPAEGAEDGALDANGLVHEARDSIGLSSPRHRYRMGNRPGARSYRILREFSDGTTEALA